MKYEIHSIKDEEGNLFHCVYETATDQPFDFFYFLDDAKKCLSFLNGGGAFDGFTPTFMLNDFKVPQSIIDINTGFMEL